MDMSMFTRYRTPLVLAAVFLVLLTPALFRWYWFSVPGIIGFPTYFHQRISQDIVYWNFNWHDSLSFGGRPYTYPPGFVFTLAPFGYLFGMEAGGVIMMALLGAITAYLFYLISREFLPGRVSLLILATLPLFIYLFSHLSTRSPPMTLGLLALYLFMKKKSWAFSAVPLGISFLFSPEAGILFWLVILFYSYWNRPGARRTALVLGVSAAIALAWLVPFFMQHGFLEMNALHTDYAAREYGMEQFSLSNYLWETSLKGLPILIYILAIPGLYYTRDNFLRTWFIFCLLIPLLYWRLFIYLLFPAALVASVGITALYRRKTRYPDYRKILAVLFSAYLIIAGGSFVLDFASNYPKEVQIRALLWIKDNTPQDAMVLSDWPSGHWVCGISYRKCFMDGYAEYAPDVDQRLEQLNQFFRDCTVPEGVDYIFLEQWLIDKYGMDCLSGLETVYQDSGMYVFRA